MTYYLATKESIVSWIKGLSSENLTYFPQRHGEVSYRFAPVQSNSDIQFENYTPTVVPPVKYLVPAREELLQFRKGADGKSEVTASLDTSFRILAGVRPCDLKGIYLMDLFFKDGVPDAYYLARRANTAIIAYSCSAACDQRAFCGAVGSANHSEGADVFVTPQAGGELLVEVKTDLGQKLASNAGWKPCKEAPDKNLSAQPSGRTFAATVPEITAIIDKSYNSPVWDKHVARCFSCGTCNLVCPTCYCFDVADDLNLDVTTGNRTRTWDGCMLPSFATVVGGHNFRPDPAARQRHRVSRKFDYLPKKYERGSVCVGCGRCGRQCTSHIDIYDIVSDLIQEGGR
jgi:sulfhydrogenase subunit beta (sulfur reductase)